MAPWSSSSPSTPAAPWSPHCPCPGARIYCPTDHWPRTLLLRQRWRYGSHPLSLLYCKCNLLVWLRAAAVRLLFSLHDGAAQCSTMACAIDLVASLKIESLIFFCLLCFLYLLACCKLSGAAEPNVFYFCWTRLVQSDPTHSWLGWFGLGLVWKKAKSDPTQPVLFWSVRITDLGKFDRNQHVYTPWIDRVNPYTHL